MFLWRNNKNNNFWSKKVPYLKLWTADYVWDSSRAGDKIQHLISEPFKITLQLSWYDLTITTFWAYSADKKLVTVFLPASVAQLDAPSDWRPGGRGFNPRRGRQHSFMEIDHEIFSTVILSLPLIQEGQLSVSGERMCTILVNRLED